MNIYVPANLSTLRTSFFFVGSCALAFCLVVLWIGSNYRTDQIFYLHTAKIGSKYFLDFKSDAGVQMWLLGVDKQPGPNSHPDGVNWFTRKDVGAWRNVIEQKGKEHHIKWFWGVGCYKEQYSFRPGYTCRQLIIPFYWPTTVAVAIAVSTVSPCFRKRFRRGKGLCLKCGYDLRATPDYCPECGHVTTE